MARRDGGTVEKKTGAESRNRCGSAASACAENWAGAISFFEPMITLAYFEQLEDKRCYALKVPAELSEPGYYPTRYCTQYVPAHGGRYTVELDQFKWYPGAQP